LEYIYNLEALGISVHKVIIFGSQAKGTFTEDSDIDIAVISNEFEMMGLWERAKYLGRVARGIPYPIEAILQLFLDICCNFQLNFSCHFQFLNNRFNLTKHDFYCLIWIKKGIWKLFTLQF